jgi:hypothetical protein
MWVFGEAYFGDEAPATLDATEQRLHAIGRRARDGLRAFYDGRARRVLPAMHDRTISLRVPGSRKRSSAASLS